MPGAVGTCPAMRAPHSQLEDRISNSKHTRVPKHAEHAGTKRNYLQQQRSTAKPAELLTSPQIPALYMLGAQPTLLPWA